MKSGYQQSIEHYRITEARRLGQWANREGFSLLELRQWLELGSFYQNGHRFFCQNSKDSLQFEQFLDQPLGAGDILRIHRAPRRFPWLPEQVQKWVKLETPNFLLLNKPTGLPTHATVDNAKENLLFHLQANGYPEALVVNRLDMGTEGLLLFARNAEAQRSLQEQTQRHEVTKIYTTAVQGRFPLIERLESWVEKSPRAPKRQSFQPQGPSDFCLTEVLEVHQLQKPLAQEGPLSGDFSILQLRLVTGKTHQIRSQMKLWGHPIIGDGMYGSEFGWHPGETPTGLRLESWALRCTALGWNDDGVDYHFELPEIGLADLRQRLEPLGDPPSAPEALPVPRTSERGFELKLFE